MELPDAAAICDGSSIAGRAMDHCGAGIVDRCPALPLFTAGAQLDGEAPQAAAYFISAYSASTISPSVAAGNHKGRTRWCIDRLAR